jgi:hypothetical protein
MPYGLSSQGKTREPHADPSKPVYRGETPLKKSDILYVEQAPGMLEINHGKLSQHTYYPGLARANSDARADLLAEFPYSPEPTKGLPRSGFRALSVNSKSLRSHMPTHNSDASGQRAYPSIPRRHQRHEATVDQASANALQIHDDHARSGRLAERIHTKSSAGRANIPPSPAPVLPTPRSLHPILLRSAHSSRIKIREVPSHVAVLTPAPVYSQSHWPYATYDEFLHEQDPAVLRGMVNRYPLSPVCNERCPEHMRPMHFDMDEPRCLEKTLRWYIHMALAQGRPLDARAGGRYHRIVDAGDPMGIVPETGADWSKQGGY